MSRNPSLYWSQLQHEHWILTIAATDKGLCYVQFGHEPLVHMTNWAGTVFPSYEPVYDLGTLLPYSQQLQQYIQGELLEFSLPLDRRGTPFQMAVWDALLQIPFGQTRSYSQLADAIARPNAVRAVGTAIGANPILIAVPCHRVIGKNGTLTGYRGGLEAKSELLQLEQKGAALCSQL